MVGLEDFIRHFYFAYTIVVVFYHFVVLFPGVSTSVLLLDLQVFVVVFDSFVFVRKLNGVVLGSRIWDIFHFVFQLAFTATGDTRF